MERLFRLGHEPALTLGNTKNIDILVRTRSEQLRTISVKAVQGGGKWPVGRRDLSNERDLVFVFLLYRSFGNVTTDPDVWIMPAVDVETRKQGSTVQPSTTRTRNSSFQTWATTETRGTMSPNPSLNSNDSLHSIHESST